MKSSANCNDGLEAFSRTLSELMDLERELASNMTKAALSSGRSVLRAARGAVNRRSADSCCAQPRFGLGSLTGSCCDIPEPCWVPKCLGEFDCALCPGSSATLRMHIENTDLQRRVIHALASGPAAKLVTFSPQSLDLGPRERGTIQAEVAVPKDARDGDRFEAILWVRGCRDYYARLTAVAGPDGCCCRYDLSLCDGPDHVLHWYDHFYCPRPCLNQVRG